MKYANVTFQSLFFNICKEILVLWNLWNLNLHKLKSFEIQIEHWCNLEEKNVVSRNKCGNLFELWLPHNLLYVTSLSKCCWILYGIFSKKVDEITSRLVIVCFNFSRDHLRKRQKQVWRKNQVSIKNDNDFYLTYDLKTHYSTNQLNLWYSRKYITRKIRV